MSELAQGMERVGQVLKATEADVRRLSHEQMVFSLTARIAIEQLGPEFVQRVSEAILADLGK